MKPIFLIGFMCSGKTTLGRAVADTAGLRFIDLDHEIERRAGMSVREIFATMGEAEFRRLEKEALDEAAATEDAIIACGGGTPCVPGAMDLINKSGTSVRLVPSQDRLIHRLMTGRRKRPLLAGIKTDDEMRRFVEVKEADRDPYYSLAAHTFDSTLLETPTEISVSVDEFLRCFINPLKK